MLDGFVPPFLVITAAAVLVGLRRAWERRVGRRGVAADVVVLAAVVCLAGTLEILMGRPPTYRNGPMRFWSGNVASDQNSQQVTDPYSFTHVIHGAAFYGLTRLALPLAPVALRAVAAISLESAWEVYENTDAVISRYRSATVSLGYYGDSMVNSFGDVLACFFGFVLAWRLPTRVTVGWVVAVEVILLVWIRDNLTLNILMLLHPVEAIRVWQMHG